MKLPFFGRGRTDPDAELDEEIESHFKMAVHDRAVRGEDPQEAECAVRREFGNVTRVKEVTREMWGGRWREQFAKDIRYTVRTLLRTPGFALVSVLTLALGIGASTAIYTLVERVVLDPLPYPAANRLVKLKSAVPGIAPGEEWHLSPIEYFFFGEEARTIEEIGAYTQGGVNMATPSGPARARAAAVTASTLRMLGAEPALGRLLDEGDDQPGAPRVTVLSHAFWRQQFGGDPSVIGRGLEIQGEPAVVVGVLTPGVELPEGPGSPAAENDLWVSYQLPPEGPGSGSHIFPMFARLKPGVTLEQAQAELDQLTLRLPDVRPDIYSERFFERYQFRTVVTPFKEYMVGDIARNLWLLFGAVGLVMLIAAANVANLFLVRIEGRRREMAVRTALGAGRWAIARQFLAEGFVLAMAGGALGVLLSMGAVRWVVSVAPASIPRLNDLQLDGSILLFALGISLVVALTLAAFPALRQRQTTGNAALSGGSRSTTASREQHRVRSTLVVTQIALALVLIVGAGLLLESFRRLRAVDPGVDPAGVLTLELNLTGDSYRDLPSMWRFYDEVLDQVRAMPGVSAAGMSQVLPFSESYGCTVQGFEDPAVYDRISSAELTTCAAQEPTTPGFFEAMGIPLLRGRTFTDADNDQPTRGAVIVSQAFAERFWPGEDPIGKGVGPSGNRQPPFYRVVGVVGDVYGSAPGEEPAIVVYYPVTKIPDTPGWWASNMRLTVRTDLSNPVSLLPAIRRAVLHVDPSIPVASAEELQVIVDASMSRLSFTMVLLALAATVALLLAAVGLYGVISYVVARRTGEIGMRIALGARPAQVQRLVVGGSLKLAGVGLTIGVLVALGVTRLMQGLLYGVESTHLAVYALAVLLLASVALAASFLPARRATRVDPMVALRAE